MQFPTAGRIARRLAHSAHTVRKAHAALEAAFPKEVHGSVAQSVQKALNQRIWRRRPVEQAVAAAAAFAWTVRHYQPRATDFMFAANASIIDAERADPNDRRLAGARIQTALSAMRVGNSDFAKKVMTIDAGAFGLTQIPRDEKSSEKIRKLAELLDTTPESFYLLTHLLEQKSSWLRYQEPTPGKSAFMEARDAVWDGEGIVAKLTELLDSEETRELLETATIYEPFDVYGSHVVEFACGCMARDCRAEALEVASELVRFSDQFHKLILAIDNPYLAPLVAELERSGRSRAAGLVREFAPA